ncbi:hypothetical protein AVEN_210180-1 [Araneus ventricosus]|uniref:Uncharacterized protein n=1 Tax=Araneus ventricosus TaxID=182803 RepID=A0A4Y2LTQ5_ARAVE|nr:hypothetical protein AVEN_210180-1 [Araneus ventricosus]
MDVGSISDERPTVISQHCRVPIPLVPFFHVLMKTQLSGKKFKWESRKWIFKDILGRNPEIKPTYSPPDLCSFRPCHSLGTLLKLDRKHPKPVFLYFEEVSQVGGL